MNIGEAAKTSGVSVKMIRHYENIGLLPAATRTASGYRVYRPEDIHALLFIRNARELGFPLTEIKELLGLWRDRGRTSAEVKRLAIAHIAAINEKVKVLQEMGKILHQLAVACHGDERPDCPILEGISKKPPASIEKSLRRATSTEVLRHSGIGSKGDFIASPTSRRSVRRGG